MLVESTVESELELGFNFIMDYNEDRQITFSQRNDEHSDLADNQTSMARNIFELDNRQHATIYFNTIGKL